MCNSATFGSAVRCFRQSAGISVRELAARTGVSHPMIVKIERGERNVGAATAIKLSGGLGLGRRVRQELLQRLFGRSAGHLAVLLVLEVLQDAGLDARPARDPSCDIEVSLGGGLEVLLEVKAKQA